MKKVPIQGRIGHRKYMKKVPIQGRIGHRQLEMKVLKRLKM